MIKAHDKIKRIEWPALAQPKIDGIRVEFYVDQINQTVNNQSRNGNPFTSIVHIHDDVLDLAAKLTTQQFVRIDGELFCGSFRETSSQIKKKDIPADDALFYAFDYDCDHCLNTRAKTLRLENAIGKGHGSIRAVETVVVAHRKKAEEIHKRHLAAGHEGTMIKNSLNDEWYRMKPTFTEDVKIAGFTEGGAGTRLQGTLGSLVVDFKGELVYVSSGLDDPTRAAIWASREDYMERLVEVQHKGVTVAGSLRHPVFVCFRDTRERPGVKV